MEFIEKHHTKILIILLLFALVIKVGNLCIYMTHNPYSDYPVTDSKYYDTRAMEITSGDMLEDGPFYMAPLYPYILALIYLIFGHSYLSVYIIQLIAGLFNLYLIYFIGKKFFSSQTGIIALAITTFYAPFTFFETKLLGTTFGISLCLLTILVLLKARDEGNTFLWFITGFLLGLALILRPNIIVFVPLVLIWIFLFRRKIKTAGLVLTALFLVLTPVIVHNYIQSGEFIFMTTNSGKTFYQGNNPYSEGVYSTSPDLRHVNVINEGVDEKKVAQREAGHSLTEKEVSRYWLNKGLRFIRENPREVFILYGKKIIRFFDSYEYPLNYSIYFGNSIFLSLAFIPFSVILVLFFLGTYISNFREYPFLLIFFYAAAGFLIALLFFVSSRYRTLFVPAFIIIAAEGCRRIPDFFGKENFWKNIISVIILWGIFVFSTVAPDNLVEKYRTKSYVNTATLYFLKYKEADNFEKKTGFFQKSLKFSRKALQIKNNDISALNLLGKLFKVKGKPKQALKHYRHSLSVYPRQGEVLAEMGALYGSMGELEKAKKYCFRSLEIAPHLSSAYVNLTVISLKEGNTSKAREYAKKAIKRGAELDPEWKVKLFRSEKN